MLIERLYVAHCALYCSKINEPSIEKVISIMFPFPFISRYISNIINVFHNNKLTIIPLKTLLDDAYFLIDFKDNIYTYTFNDIYLIQEKDSIQQYVCKKRVTRTLLGPMLQQLCTYTYSNTSPLTSNSQFTQSNDNTTLYNNYTTYSSSSDNWVISNRPVCSSRLINNQCRVDINPLIASCIWIRDFESTSNSEVPAVVYHTQLHTLNMTESLLPYTPYNTSNETIMLLPLRYLDNVLSYIPLYVVYAFVGVYLFINVDRLCMNSYLQYILLSVYTTIGYTLFMTYLTHRYEMCMFIQ